MADAPADARESHTERAADPGEPTEPPTGSSPESTAPYEPVPITVSAVIGLAVAYGTVWWASGNAVFYEELFRVVPTVQGGGVGTDWVVGNTIPAFDFLIALTHAADVIMGLGILLLLFVHWASFRRLAARMQSPGSDQATDAAVTDGSEIE